MRAFASTLRARALFALAAACAAGAAAYLAWVLWLAPGPEPSVLAWTALANATYPVELAPSKQVTLKDGLAEQQLVPGSASRLQVRLAEIAGFGDIAGTADIDAAVVLIVSGGGSGTFINLVAVANQDGQPAPAATTLLGDRVAVRGIEVKDRAIAVRMRVRGATEPFTNLSREVTRTYALDGGQLVLRGETTADVPDDPPSAFAYPSEDVAPAPGGDALTRSAVLPPGESATFIVHGASGQRLSVGVSSDFNNAVLSIQGLGDLAQLASRSQFLARFEGPLPTTQDYSIRVVSLAGAPLRYDLSIELGKSPATPVASPTAPTTATSQPSPTVSATATATVTARPSATPSVPPGPPLNGPFRPVQRDLGALSGDAASFVAGRTPTWSVAIADPAAGLMYSLNGDAQLELASVVKVLIMAAVFGAAEREGRYVDDVELSLLWPMITQSDNDAATSLWHSVGGGRGLASYLQASGLGGITPYDGEFWGTSTASAKALAGVVARLLLGDLVRSEHRALALKLMTSVVAAQRWGISAGADPAAGDLVALKDGWYPDERGWRVNSIGLVVPGDRTRQPYVVAVLTNLQPSWDYGIATIEGTARRAAEALRAAGSR